MLCVWPHLLTTPSRALALRSSVAPRSAEGTRDRRREGHARRGGRYGHIAVRSRSRPPHLDRLRRLRRAEYRDPDPCHEGFATRPRPFRLRARGQQRPGAGATGSRQDHRRDLGAQTRAKPLSSPTTSPWRFTTCGRGTRLWQASILRPMHRKTRLPLRRRRSTRSANRACRCHSRWPIPFPFRSSSSSSHGRRFSLSRSQR